MTTLRIIWSALMQRDVYRQMGTVRVVRARGGTATLRVKDVEMEFAEGDSLQLTTNMNFVRGNK